MNELPYFIFNNYKSSDLGILIKEMPPIAKAEKNIENITINGRNGDLHIDNETYKSKKYSISCVLLDKSKIDQIKDVFDGSGTLELSTELGREYQAVIKNQINFSKYLTYLKEFVLQFELYPIAYAKEEKIVSCISSKTFVIGGSSKVSPKILINGTGKISLNNYQIEVYETNILIDCDLMNCTQNNINKNDKVNLEEFPILTPGENDISIGSGINSVEIRYKEGWL